MTCLVLRAYLKTTYRGVVDFLASSQELCVAIGLKSLPHYSSSNALPIRSAVAEIADAMFAEIIKECAPDAKEMAVDSTGIQTTAACAYFQTVRAKEHEIRQAFARGSLRKLVSLRLGGELGTTNGPRGSSEILEKAMARLRPKKLYADAGLRCGMGSCCLPRTLERRELYSTKCAPQGRFGRGHYRSRWSRCRSPMVGVGTLKRS